MNIFEAINNIAQEEAAKREAAFEKVTSDRLAALQHVSALTECMEYTKNSHISEQAKAFRNKYTKNEIKAQLNALGFLA